MSGRTVLGLPPFDQVPRVLELIALRELGRRATTGGVPPDFGIRVLRAIARELGRGTDTHP